MIQPDDFAPIATLNPDAGYNAHYKAGDWTVSVSYGGMSYGGGFRVRPDGRVDGSFEVCVFNRETDEVMAGDDGYEVRGWVRLNEVNDLIASMRDDKR